MCKNDSLCRPARLLFLTCVRGFFTFVLNKEHDGNVVSAYRGTPPGPSLDRQTPAFGLPFCRKVMVAGGGHGCIVSSIPEPRQGHSLPKTGPLPSYFCVKRPWLLFVHGRTTTSMRFILASADATLYTLLASADAILYSVRRRLQSLEGGGGGGGGAF